MRAISPNTLYTVHIPAITGDQSQDLPPSIRKVWKEGFDEKVRPTFAIENHWLLKIMTLKV